jgi:hypothetical protein
MHDASVGVGWRHGPGLRRASQARLALLALLLCCTAALLYGPIRPVAKHSVAQAQSCTLTKPSTMPACHLNEPRLHAAGWLLQPLPRGATWLQKCGCCIAWL